jgi:hypothetical protein
MLSQVRDLGHAARTLVKTRVFTAVCVTSLGLGMGVVMAIMLLCRMVLGTPPSVNDDGLVELVIRPTGALQAQAGTAIIDTWSYPDYLDVRDGASGMAISGWSRGEGLVQLPGESRATSVPTMYVSSDYFSIVGVALARGSGFTPANDASLAAPEAIIGHRAWQLRFGRDPDIIGRAVVINQTVYVIVGVAPEGFRGHVSGLDGSYFQLWLPLSRHPRVHFDAQTPRALAAEPAAAGNVRFKRDAALVRVVARLPGSMTPAPADAMIRSAMRTLAERYSATNQDKVGGVDRISPPGRGCDRRSRLRG